MISSANPTSPEQEVKVHLVIGTKAQLIKMFPIIRELRARHIPYNYIDTCQHPLITREFRHAFNIDEPDVMLGNPSVNITGIAQAIFWLIGILYGAVFNKKKIFAKGRGGVCLIHGDTLSTLLGLWIGKLGGLKIAHIEAGERTHKLLGPFPEEIIRIIVDRFSDYAFSSSEVSFNNLQREKIKGEIVPMAHNTIVDAIRVAASQDNIRLSVPETYVLVSIHRFETIQSKKRLEFVVDTVLQVAQEFPVVWGLHEPTKKQLLKYGLLDRISAHRNIELRGLWDYFTFIKAIRLAEFLITDGGGPQEESWFLNTPCMLMRSETERDLHPNVHRTNFQEQEVGFFLDHYHTLQSDDLKDLVSPSVEIVDFLQKRL